VQGQLLAAMALRTPWQPGWRLRDRLVGEAVAMAARVAVMMKVKETMVAVAGGLMLI
jgi:hypothetical protein